MLGFSFSKGKNQHLSGRKRTKIDSWIVFLSVKVFWVSLIFSGTYAIGAYQINAWITKHWEPFLEMGNIGCSHHCLREVIFMLLAWPIVESKGRLDQVVLTHPGSICYMTF